MKNRLTILYFLIFLATLAGNTHAQRINEFQKEFQAAADTGFDSVAIEGLFKKHGSVLMPFNQPTQLAMGMRGQEWVKFPLAWMQTTAVYQDNINVLLNAREPAKRMLGYLMVASSGDFTKRGKLAKDLRACVSPDIEMWLGMALMSLGYDHTSELFRWVVRNNVKAGGYLFPLLVSLPKDSLRAAAIRFSKSSNWEERVYAVQSLEYTGKNPQTEQILRNAIATWPIHLKGYAIFPAKSLQIGKLSALLKPVLDSSATRKVALEALADSPTPADRAFLSQLANNNATDPEILNALKGSRHQQMVIDWLSHLPKLGENDSYYFHVYRDTLLRQDNMLPYVQKTTAAIKNPKILSNLLPALKGRADSVSQKLLVGYLTDSTDAVRSAAGEALRGTCSDLLKTALPRIVGTPHVITHNTFDLAIGCGLDGFQDFAEANYRSSSQERMTRMNALNYLATYPQPRHLPLLRETLKMDPAQEFMQTRAAARGLATLADTTSVEAIIQACEVERKKSDMNTFDYVGALARLKGDRAKAYLESFLTSESDLIVKEVTNLLKDW